MKAASTAKYARTCVAVAASRGRIEESVLSLDAAANFFASADGRAAAEILQTSRIPRAEREGLLGDIIGSLSLTKEVGAVVCEFAAARALSMLGTVAMRARAFASKLAPHAEAELRTAQPLSAEATDSIRVAAERLVGRPVKMSVVEDASLVGGVILRIGNSIWDGSLSGRLARAAEALARP